jgi:phosphatidate cytidylyltransferase
MKRLATAAALAALALSTIFWAPLWLFITVALTMGALCYRELDQLVRHYGIPPLGWVGLLSGIALTLTDPRIAALIALVAFVTALLRLDVVALLPWSAVTLLAAVFLFFPWWCAVQLRAAGPWWVFFALAINWVGDAAAYYAGRAFGRHKLAPRISPAKSWEGTLASLGAALIFAWAMRPLLGNPSVPATVVLGLVGNASGQLGDLVESAIKRGAGVKDSGHWLPGHGGFLDRLDSTFFSLPVIYYLREWLFWK